MGVTIAQAQAMLDSSAAFPTSAASDFIAYSTNGTSETGNLARTAVGATGWAAATSADPSIKANNAVLTSAAVITAGITVTSFALYSASSAGTQKTDWQALTASRALSVGDSVQWAIGALQVTLT
jgi:hypothetical protein